MSIRNNTLLELDEFLPYRLSLLSNTVSAAIAAHGPGMEITS